MRRTRYLLSHINLINILLTAVLIFLVNYILLPFLSKSILYSLPAVKKHGKTEPLTSKQEQPKMTSPLDYMVITEQNLFHPERKIPVEVKQAQPLPKPDFVLYGTLINDELQIAYIEDRKSPQSTPGRGKRQSALKLGSSLSGFSLKRVETDKVLMVRGEENIIVLLDDPQKQKSRETQTIETTVAQQKSAIEPAKQESESQQKPSVSQTQPAATPFIPVDPKQTLPRGSSSGGGGLMRFFGK